MNMRENNSSEMNIGNRIETIQSYLQAHHLDGWFIYDCEGINSIAGYLFGDMTKHLTRRWFYLIPAKGEPTYLFHSIEIPPVTPYPGTIETYHGWRNFQHKTEEILASATRIALEYSPMAALPSLSKVDGGTIELLKHYKKELFSSAGLVQFFTSRLSSAQYQSHLHAVQALYRVKDRFVTCVKDEVEKGYYANEYQLQQRLLSYFSEEDLESEFPPIVAIGPNSGNPHYQAGPDNARSVAKDEVLLLDIWARKKYPQAVYGDITWMFFLGTSVPDHVKTVFDTVVGARDRVVSFLKESHTQSRRVLGYEADDIARQYIAQRGYEKYFLHRTGHNLGSDVHGPGSNLDNLETHEERELMPHCAFTIEPGIYLPEFGIRSEIDVFHDPGEGFIVTTPPQKELTCFNVL